MRSTGRFSEWEKKGRFSNFEFREHRDKASLDIFWLRDESFGNPTHRTAKKPPVQGRSIRSNRSNRGSLGAKKSSHPDVLARKSSKTSKPPSGSEALGSGFLFQKIFRYGLRLKRR
jgi:hypothetical protein